jgi:uncharacterized protein YoxC
MPLSSTAGDLAQYALAGFLVVVGLALGFAFFRLGQTFGNLARFLSGLEREVLPVITKVGGSVDRVNTQLDKVDEITTSAVDAVESIDATVRTVSHAVTAPVKKVSGWAAAVRGGASALRSDWDLGEAMSAARSAAHEREQALEDDLKAED